MTSHLFLLQLELADRALVAAIGGWLQEFVFPFSWRCKRSTRPEEDGRGTGRVGSHPKPPANF